MFKILEHLPHSFFHIYQKFDNNMETIHNQCQSSGPKVIKLFSCSSQMSTKFQLVIKTKIPTNEEVYCFKSLRCCIYPADKCLNANDCWHFNIYEQDKICAQLS